LIGNWNDIPLFLALVKHGRMAAAAHELGINHATVHRRLNRMEDELGVRLFDRRPDGYLLTESGREMLPVAERTAEEIQKLQVRLAGKDIRPSGVVRVTTTDTVASHVVLPLLPGFNARYPEVKVSLIMASQYRDLSRFEADLAVRVTDAPPEHLIGQRLLKPRWRLYAAPAYLDQLDVVPSRDNLHLCEIITASDLLGRFEVMQRLQSWLPADYQPALEVNSLMHLYLAVRQGLGIGLLPNYITDHNAELIPLEIEIGEIDAHIWALIHPDLQHVQRVRVLLQYLAENIKKKA
jgi:DNA-binding transcriptional LysR family regulator